MSSLPSASAPAASPAKIAANQANAQLSTGPASPEGKAKSSLNAVKTALTGRTILLPAEDVAAYQQHVEAYTKDLQPVGRRESDLVQSIADSSWRLLRIPTLEAAIYAQGRIQFANHFDEHDPALRASFIEFHTHLTYEKQLRNLALQESRLHRRREKDLAELRDLQKERKQEQNNAFEAASRLQMQAKRANQPFDLAQFGFEFSTDDLQSYTDGDSVSRIIRAAHKKASASSKIAA